MHTNTCKTNKQYVSCIEKLDNNFVFVLENYL